MKPCLNSCGCLAPEFCKAGAQECHINAYAEGAMRHDQRSHWMPRVGRTFRRECLGETANGTPVYEQVEV